MNPHAKFKLTPNFYFWMAINLLLVLVYGGILTQLITGVILVFIDTFIPITTDAMFNTLWIVVWGSVITASIYLWYKMNVNSPKSTLYRLRTYLKYKKIFSENKIVSVSDFVAATRDTHDFHGELNYDIHEKVNNDIRLLIGLKWLKGFQLGSNHDYFELPNHKKQTFYQERETIKALRDNGVISRDKWWELSEKIDAKESANQANLFVSETENNILEDLHKSGILSDSDFKGIKDGISSAHNSDEKSAAVQTLEEVQIELQKSQTDAIVKLAEAIADGTISEELLEEMENTPTTVTEELTALNAILQAGLITQEDFEQVKKGIIDGTGRI